MASSFTVDGSKLQIDFWYRGDVAKVQAIVEAASELLYTDRGFENIYDGEGVLIPWDTLTNLQQLAVVDRYIRITVIDLANSKNKADAAVEAIAEVVELEFDDD